MNTICAVGRIFIGFFFVMNTIPRIPSNSTEAVGALFFEVAFPFALTSYSAGLFFTALGLSFHTGIYFLQGRRCVCVCRPLKTHTDTASCVGCVEFIGVLIVVCRTQRGCMCFLVVNPQVRPIWHITLYNYYVLCVCLCLDVFCVLICFNHFVIVFVWHVCIFVQSRCGAKQHDLNCHSWQMLESKTVWIGSGDQWLFAQTLPATQETCTSCAAEGRFLAMMLALLLS